MLPSAPPVRVTGRGTICPCPKRAREVGVECARARARRASFGRRVEGGRPSPFFFLFLCSDADRLPVFVRLSISGAGQVGEGQGALKAEVLLPQKNFFLDVKACIGFS